MLNGHHDRQRIILYLEVDDLVKQNHRRHLEIKDEKLREEITSRKSQTWQETD